MAILFNEYLIKDALYYNLTHKHTRDRDNDVNNSTYAPFGTGKTIYLYDSSVVPYPANAIDSTFETYSPGGNPILDDYLYSQAFDSNITIDDNATRGDVRDDKIYFNTVLFFSY